MNLLLDTHILLWHLSDHPKLNIETSALIENEAHQKYRCGFIRTYRPNALRWNESCNAPALCMKTLERQLRHSNAERWNDKTSYLSASYYA